MNSKHFTEEENLETDEKVLSDLKQIKEFLLSNLTSPEAFVLVGSFGRGEGKMIMGGGLRPANDYDVMVVTEEDISKQKAREFSKEIEGKLGTPVDLIFERRSSLEKLPPTIRNFDTKYGHFVFHGSDRILEQVPSYSPKDIPLREGQYLMRNRLVCLLESFSLDFIKRSLSNNEKNFLLAQTSKAILASSDAILLSKGLYNVSYRERSKRFAQEFASDKSNVELVKIATEIKLSDKQLETDPLIYWQGARNFLLLALDKLPPLRNECSLVRRTIKHLKGEDNLDCLKQNIEELEINLLIEINDSFVAPTNWETERKRVVELWYKHLH